MPPWLVRCVVQVYQSGSLRAPVATGSVHGNSGIRSIRSDRNVGDVKERGRCTARSGRLRRWRAPVVLIDGQSGSGKTSLAGALADACGIAGVRGLQVIHLDHFYAGWTGLAAGTHTLERLLTSTYDQASLQPRNQLGCCESDPGILLFSTPMPYAPLSGRHQRTSQQTGFWQWDWEQNRWGHYVRLNPDRPVLIEGSGSLTAVTRSAADLAIWVELDADCFPNEAAERKRRAVRRDGDVFRPWWDAWAKQEAGHLAKHKPRKLADVIVLR